MNLVLAQKSFELIGIEIRQNLVARDERRDIRLIGDLPHFLICLSIFPDVNLDELVAALAQIILGVNAPRAPFPAIKLQFHWHSSNKRAVLKASTKRKCALVRFRPNDAARARFTSENAPAGFGGIAEQNAADGDFEIVLDFFFDFA